MKNLIIVCFLIFTNISLYAAGLTKYTVVKPDDTIDSTGLQLSILDIYNTFQPRKFDKFNTIPEANQIGEQQIVLYRSTSTNNARLYTIIDNTTYYVTLGTTTVSEGDMLKSIYDTSNNGIVDNSEKFNNLVSSQFARTDTYNNFVGSISVIAPTTVPYIATFGTTTTNNMVAISTNGDVDISGSISTYNYPSVSLPHATWVTVHTFILPTDVLDPPQFFMVGAALNVNDVVNYSSIGFIAITLSTIKMITQADGNTGYFTMRVYGPIIQLIQNSGGTQIGSCSILRFK